MASLPYYNTSSAFGTLPPNISTSAISGGSGDDYATKYPVDLAILDYNAGAPLKHVLTTVNASISATYRASSGRGGASFNFDAYNRGLATELALQNQISQGMFISKPNASVISHLETTAASLISATPAGTVSPNNGVDGNATFVAPVPGIAPGYKAIINCSDYQGPQGRISSSVAWDLDLLPMTSAAYTKLLADGGGAFDLIVTTSFSGAVDLYDFNQASLEKLVLYTSFFVNSASGSQAITGNTFLATLNAVSCQAGYGVDTVFNSMGGAGIPISKINSTPLIRSWGNAPSFKDGAGVAKTAGLSNILQVSLAPLPSSATVGGL